VKQVARILVNINIREGLSETINLVWRPEVISQILDYENIPFYCRHCHAYGHPISECSLPVHTFYGGKKKLFTKGKPSVPEKGLGSLESNPLSVDESGKEMVSEASEHCSHVEDALVSQTMVPSVPPHEELSREPPHPGTPSFSLNPAVNLYMNNVSIVGSDWVEGLRNLTISSPSGLPLAFSINPCVVGGFTSKKISTGGLGKSLSPVRIRRGRKSNLHKAQSKAKMDLVEGKQLSIEKALREVKA